VPVRIRAPSTTSRTPSIPLSLWLLKNNNLLSQEKGYLPAFEEKKEGILLITLTYLSQFHNNQDMLPFQAVGQNT